MFPVHYLEQSMIKDKERADMKITKLEEEVSSLKLENSNDKAASLDENDHKMREGDNIDSSAQIEKTDNLINQLHGEIAKVWVFWEGHKIWKNLRCTFDKNVLVKKSTKIVFKNVDKSYYTNFTIYF